MTTSHAGSSSRRSMALTTSSSQKKRLSQNGTTPDRRSSLTASRSMGLTGERTVKRLRLSKALTVPDTTSIYEACRRMAARRVDALLLTDSRSLLCGILTDKDIATRVIAREIDFENTPVSKVMTRNPVFVLSDTLAVEALQKMKCLYDAIARMERAAEKGKAIAAAVEGVEKHWGSSVSGSNTFVESLRERMFMPSLSTIISENPKSKDILMRVIAQDLRPELILVEKVMTPNPECATLDTPIVNALHNMHDGKYLHLPVVDRGIDNEAASSMMQKFWDSAMAITPADDEDDLRRLLTYEDEDHDKVILATDSDLAAAVEHARLSGWKGIKLHLDYSGIPKRRKGSSTAGSLEFAQRDAWTTAYSTVAAGAALVAGLGMVAFLRRAG
ncbi:Cystathionine beta-synthase, core [Cynara cardunculus var. scolymus]|uniref:Cystathionine beta-synthase, core n=1 Tax=Cynara cardunculus var. scolymus TaxID=59895 RepID=A0A118JYH6_CYNCS|nr:Cystathionine beta-synthase, core [Cynara cardunculus var. scolymus]